MGAGDRGALRGQKGTGGAERRREPAKGQGKKGVRMSEGRNRGTPGCAVRQALGLHRERPQPSAREQGDIDPCVVLSCKGWVYRVRAGLVCFLGSVSTLGLGEGGP